MAPPFSRQSPKSSRNAVHSNQQLSEASPHGLCQRSSSSVRIPTYFRSSKPRRHLLPRHVSHKQIMSLPGLGLEEPEDNSFGQGSQSQTYDLNKETEWRFEVVTGRSVNVKIIAGSSEIFGTELVLGHTYTFVSAKAAIYTWTGCSFEASSDHGPLSSALLSEYVAEETMMQEYINTHFALESLREQAQRHNTQGPRVLVLGPENAGKTSLCKVLTGYAVRSGRAPTVVNIDPTEGVLSLPGTLTAILFKTLIEVEEGWGNAPMSGPNGEIPVKMPLVYYYGSLTPDEKSGAIYERQTTRLALAVQGRLAQDTDAKFSGVIIDTPGSLAGGKGYDVITHIVSDFSINCIVCLGSERLYSDMVRRFDKTPISGSRVGANGEQEKVAVVKISKGGGVVDRDFAYMRALRELQVRTYFYGNPKIGAGISLQPRQQQVDFDSITVWRRISPRGTGMSMAMGGAGALDEEDSFLPGGADDTEVAPARMGGSTVPLPSTQIFERLTIPLPALRNCVLAVLNCEPEPTDNEQAILRDSSVMGFLYVTDLDEARGRISLLSPVAGRVPARALVWAEGIDSILGLT